MGHGRPIQARPVDMGLPSGVQWASCNIGGEKPSDPGLYFSWGNTEGHAEGSGYDFSQTVYDATPAASIAADISLEQDAARVNLGAPWRMPTGIELQELIDNCASVWTTLNGVDGYLFTSNVNGNTIFLPAAGYYTGQSLVSGGNNGYFWSSSFISDSRARGLNFGSSSINSQYSGYRRLGFTVRAVMPPL